MDKSELIKNANRVLKEGDCHRITCNRCHLNEMCPLSEDEDPNAEDSQKKIVKATKAWLAENDSPPTPFKDIQTAIIEAAKGLQNSGAIGALQRFEKAISRLNIDKTDISPIKKGRWLQYCDNWYYLVDVATYTDHPSPEGPAYVLYKGHRYCLPKHVEITDALACSRVQFGPVWVMCNDSNEPLGKEVYSLIGVKDLYHIIDRDVAGLEWEYARLATPEEIAAAGIKEES